MKRDRAMKNILKREMLVCYEKVLIEEKSQATKPQQRKVKIKKETGHWSVSREESMKKIYQKNNSLFF